MTLSEQPLVAFNAHLLAGGASYRSAGISAYIANLLKHLHCEKRGLQLVALLDKAATLDATHHRLIHSCFPTSRPGLRILWEQFFLPLVLYRLGAKLLHAPAFVGPLLSPCPQIVTVHDLSFLRYPEFFRRGNRFYLSTMTGAACRKASAVIAVSEFTAREVVSLLGVSADRVHTIYNGVDPRFRPLPIEPVTQFREQLDLPEKFILFLGTLEPRKNLVALVSAFAHLKDPQLHLILAGGRGWLYEDLFAQVERLDIQDRVHFPGYIPSETQVLWYNAARVFAYVSTYEGFGLPVLESLACGIPVLTSDTSSLPEAAGNGALLVPPDDVLAIADGLHRLLTDEDFRITLRDRGLAHAASLSWNKTARNTLLLYKQILSLE